LLSILTTSLLRLAAAAPDSLALDGHAVAIRVEKRSIGSAALLQFSREHGFPSHYRLPLQIDTGSGFLWDGGLVLTAHHVVSGAEAISVSWNGTSSAAEIAAAAPRLDIALLRLADDIGIEPIPLFPGLPPPGMGLVLEGFPGGGGAVGVEGRMAGGPAWGELPGYWHPVVGIQAQIGTGMSGGPVTADGLLAGMLVAARPGDGMAYAIPADWLEEVIPDVLLGQPPGGGELGLTLRSLEDGLAVLEVSPGSPADVAGVLPGERIRIPDLQRLRQLPKGAVVALEKESGESAALRPTVPSSWASGGGDCAWRGLQLKTAGGGLTVVSMEPGNDVLGLRVGDSLRSAAGKPIQTCGDLPRKEGALAAAIVRGAHRLHLVLH
jgi:S1-C subfamily serine protease